MDNIRYCALIPDGNGLGTFRYVPQPSSCLKCRVLQLAFRRHISRISVSICGFRSLNSCVLRKNLPAEELLVTLRPNTRRPVLRRFCCRNFRLQEAENNLALIIDRRIFIKRFVYFNNVATAEKDSSLYREGSLSQVRPLRKSFLDSLNIHHVRAEAVLPRFFNEHCPNSTNWTPPFSIAIERHCPKIVALCRALQTLQHRGWQ